MAYRSWLKDVKRLDDLANSLHFFPRNHREWDREMMYEDRDHEHIRNPYRPTNLDPDAYQFFEYALHDGHVLGVQRIEDRLEITITSESLYLFTSEYFAEIEDPRDPIRSPVRLVFEGVNYVNAVRCDPEGWLKWDDWEKWRPMDDLRCTDTFLRGYFSEQDGKMQWVGHFCKYVYPSRKDPWNLFLLVDCERASAKPESERALRKRLGDQAYEVWSHLQSEPFGSWLHNLRRYLEEQGIPIRHIPHQSER